LPGRFCLLSAPRGPVIGTFRRTMAGLHEEKATSVAETLPYIAP
jgi:hypothetical protein